MPSKTHVIKVTGVTGELLKLVDERAERLHFGGRAEYVRELIRRDVLSSDANRPLPQGGARTVEEVEAIFALIEAHQPPGIKPLAPGADSREAIYGDRG